MRAEQDQRFSTLRQIAPSPLPPPHTDGKLGPRRSDGDDLSQVGRRVETGRTGRELDCWGTALDG